MHFQFRRGLTAFAFLTLLSSNSWADLIDYSQDFEALDQQSFTALGDDGWLVFGQVFDSAGNFLFPYGSFPAPNSASPDPNAPPPAFAAIVDGFGGPEQGEQHLVAFNDYNCCAPGEPVPLGHFGDGIVQSNLFQAQTVGAGDVGSSFTFGFDALGLPTDAPFFGVGGDTTASAFIRIIDADDGFLVDDLSIDMTNTPIFDWNSFALDILIDPTWVDQILTFGFFSEASNFDPSAVIYDNINFGRTAAVPLPGTVLLLAAGFFGFLGSRRLTA